MCPRNIERKDFFDSFGLLLAALPEVKDLRVSAGEGGERMHEALCAYLYCIICLSVCLCVCMYGMCVCMYILSCVHFTSHLQLVPDAFVPVIKMEFDNIEVKALQARGERAACDVGCLVIEYERIPNPF